MKVLINPEGVVIDIAEEMTEVENGIRVGDIVYAERTLSVVDAVVPEGVKPQTHKYLNGEFVTNPDYTPFFSPEERIAKLEGELSAAQTDTLAAFEALAEVYEMLLAMQPAE